MPSPKEKQVRQFKLGRNDPCWCGSGRKYKDCHLPIEDAQRAEQRKLRQAQDTLLPKIMEAARTLPQEFPAALERFWQGKYTPEQMDELDDLEDRGAERFLTWFAFDYLLSGEQTLVEALVLAAERGEFEADAFETRLLHAWAAVRLHPYLVEEVHKGKGFVARDLLDQQRLCTVEEHAASRRIQAGEVLVGHLVPVGSELIGRVAGSGDSSPDAAQLVTEPVYYVAGAVAQLTGDTREPMVDFAHLHLEDLRRSQPAATMADLLRQRSYVFNHFVMELPAEHTPGILDDILLRTRTALQIAGVLPIAGDSSAEEPAPEHGEPATGEEPSPAQAAEHADDGSHKATKRKRPPAKELAQDE